MRPRRRLPDRPDLDQLRHQARDLQRTAAGGDPAALARIGGAPARPTLSAAQLALAREYGFASWPRLVAEVGRRRAAAEDRAAGDRAAGGRAAGDRAAGGRAAEAGPLPSATPVPLVSQDPPPAPPVPPAPPPAPSAPPVPPVPPVPPAPPPDAAEAPERYRIRPAASLEELAGACDVIGAQLTPPTTRTDRRCQDLLRRFPEDQALMLVVQDTLVVQEQTASRTHATPPPLTPLTPPMPAAPPRPLSPALSALPTLASTHAASPTDLVAPAASASQTDPAAPAGLALPTDSGHIVGGALAFRTGPRGVTLRMIGLAPRVRGRGLGRRLMAAVELAAIRLGAGSISLGAGRNLGHFYARLGYAGRGAMKQKGLPLPGPSLEARLRKLAVESGAGGATPK